MKNYILSILLFLLAANSFCQTKKQFDSIKIVLEKTLIDDQQYRDQWDSVQQKFGFNSSEFVHLLEKMHFQDSLNMIVIGNILDKFGWLPAAKMSQDSTDVLFLVIQHATLPFQVKYLPVMKRALAQKKAKPRDYALLSDRTNMNLGKFQIYGTQLNADASGKWHLWPIADEPNVDKRRKSVGLPGMQVYLNMFNPPLIYKLPKTDRYKNKIVLKGSAKDFTENIPLQNISVYLGNTIIAKTDPGGYFQAAIDVKYKKHSIIFRKENFETFTFIPRAENTDVIEINPVIKQMAKKN